MISIAISTYNHGRYLPQLMDCCLRAKEFVAEVIVCDDCSSDDTPIVLEEWSKKNPQLRWHRNPTNIGIGKTVKFVLDQVTTDDFLFIPSDDYFDPPMLQKLVEYKAHTRADICYGKYTIEDGNNLIYFRHIGWTDDSYAGGRDEFVALFKNDMYMLPGATIFSKRLFESLPFYDDELDVMARKKLFGNAHGFCCQDWRLALILARDEMGKFAFLNETVSTFRRVAGQITGDTYGLSGRAAAEYAYLIDEFLNDATYPRLRHVLLDMHGLLSYKCQLHEEHLESLGQSASREFLDQTRKGFAKLARYTAD